MNGILQFELERIKRFVMEEYITACVADHFVI